MKDRVKRSVWSAHLVTGLGTGLFALLAFATLALQQQILDLARDTREQMVPEAQARFRVVRNIEILRSYGNVAYRTTDVRVRRDSGFLATLLTTHLNVKTDPATSQLLREANRSVQAVVDGDLGASKWPEVDRRLSIHADRLSIAAEAMTLKRAIDIETAVSHMRNFALVQALLFAVCIVVVMERGRVLLKRMNAKNQYFNELSHDLRQRVHSMELALGSAAQGPIEMVQEQMARIGTLMADLQRYLDNFLDVARMDAVLVKPVMSQLPVSQLFQQLALQLEGMAEHHGIDLRFKHSALTVYTDEKWLRRVMENLIVNAVKFARRRVLVATRRRAQGLELIVIDDGPGITSGGGHHGPSVTIPDDAFDSFVQGTSAAKAADHGFGLGMVMVRRTVKMLKGRLEVRSTEGRGTSIRVWLPVRQ